MYTGVTLAHGQSSYAHARLVKDSRFEISPHHGFRCGLALDPDDAGVDWTEIDARLDSASGHVASKELVEELDRYRSGSTCKRSSE